MESRSYHAADDRLRVLQKLDIRRTDWSDHERAGRWEEYRYDALGRRVLVRTRTDGGLCDTDAWTCTPSTTTFVWAGDQLLWELKEASGTYASAAGGNVGYFHAGGIDRPLVITKNGESIVPHQNWRGQFARGTYADGTKVGQRSDCTTYPASGCTPIQWPGERTTARHELEPDNNIQNWFGSLVDDMRDASGQMYRRNRYYDPQTGQFTQPDPIGLAGGLNAYGFAEGDPVSYDDPYGLCVIPIPCPRGLVGWLTGGLSRLNPVNLNAAGLAVTGALAAGAVIRKEYEEELPNFRYHRRESPTQTPEDARRQQESGELWGRAPRYGRTPAAQAFRGPLPAGVRGIEFTTPIRPDSDGGALVYWSQGRPGVETVVANGEEYAKIPIVVTKNTQTPR